MQRIEVCLIKCLLCIFQAMEQAKAFDAIDYFSVNDIIKSKENF
ncbi:MAG: hypothetical protein UFA98_06515 [Ruminococcus sp.]|nr:hypothetical protein [Ruminococcus sp.]